MPPPWRRLASEGVTDRTVCAPGRFCGDGLLRRWVIAVWLVRVIDGTDPNQGGTTPGGKRPDPNRYRPSPSRSHALH